MALLRTKVRMTQRKLWNRSRIDRVFVSASDMSSMAVHWRYSYRGGRGAMTLLRVFVMIELFVLSSDMGNKGYDYHGRTCSVSLAQV